MEKHKDAILFGIALAIFLACHMIVYTLDKRDEPKITLPEPVPVTVVEVTGPVDMPNPVDVKELPALTVVKKATVEPGVPDINIGHIEPAYTDADLEALALVIYQEAGGDACSDETRIMVGNVVMNRVADERFPDTIEEVLLAKRQYGRLHWTGLVWPERASQSVEAHAVERAYDCAKRVLEGERLLPDDVIWQAEFVQGTEIVAQQDGFYFCR